MNTEFDGLLDDLLQVPRGMETELATVAVEGTHHRDRHRHRHRQRGRLRERRRRRKRERQLMKMEGKSQKSEDILNFRDALLISGVISGVILCHRGGG